MKYVPRGHRFVFVMPNGDHRDGLLYTTLTLMLEEPLRCSG